MEYGRVGVPLKTGRSFVSTFLLPGRGEEEEEEEEEVRSSFFRV